MDDYGEIARASSSVRLLKLFEEGEQWDRESSLSPDSELFAIQRRTHPREMFQNLDMMCLLGEVSRELVRRYRAGFLEAGITTIPDPAIDNFVAKTIKALRGESRLVGFCYPKERGGWGPDVLGMLLEETPEGWVIVGSHISSGPEYSKFDIGKHADKREGAEYEWLGEQTSAQITERCHPAPAQEDPIER